MSNNGCGSGGVTSSSSSSNSFFVKMPRKTMREMVGGCCVCSDERGWDENPLVYCDGQGCNVAVHQGTNKKKSSTKLASKAPSKMNVVWICYLDVEPYFLENSVFLASNLTSLTFTTLKLENSWLQIRVFLALNLTISH